MGQRVIAVVGRVLDQEDGLHVYAANLLKEMMRIDALSRYIVLLRTAKHAGLFDSYPNAETLVLPARLKAWWDQGVVARAAQQVKADIVFNPKFSLPLWSRKPGVMVLHGSDWYVNPGNYPWWDNVYIRLVMPLYCKRAAQLCAISQRIRDDLVGFAGVDPDKVTVTYAAPSSHFQVIADQARLAEFSTRYRLPDRFILAVLRAYHTGHGHLPPYPGGNIERLVAGYRQYRSQGGKLPMVVAGKDIDRYLEARGFGSDDIEGLQFTGFIPHGEMANLYNLADFMILPTLYESFAFPLVEAMACGCPAAVSRTGACPEIAGDAARLFNPFDTAEIAAAMAGLAGDEALRERLRRAGLERAQAFTWQRTAERTLTVFNQIVPVEGIERVGKPSAGTP